MSREKLRALARRKVRVPWTAVELELEELEPFWDEVEGVIVEETLPILLSIVNAKTVPEMRQVWGSFGLPENWSDRELQEFHDQLQKVWLIAEAKNLNKRPDESELQPIWQQWFRDSLNGNLWHVVPLAGKLVPKLENIRAIAGRVLIHNTTRLARCANEPECQRFFLKDRRDSRYCLEEGCRRYAAGRERTKQWRASKSKLTRATRTRKGRQQ